MPYNDVTLTDGAAPSLPSGFLPGDVLEHEANSSLTMVASVSLYVQAGIFAWIKSDGHL